ncbi:prospero homeobox protein 2 [Podarcis muralis]
MNGNPIADHYDYRPTSGHAGGQKGDTCVERDGFFSPASYYASIISHLLSQPQPNGELDPSFLLPSSQKTELLFQSAGDGTCPRETSSPSPDCGLINSSQFHNEHLQAKRARVENIIRGMSLTPNPIVPGIQVEGDQNHLEKVKGSYRENKRKQRVPQQQSLHDISLARAGQNGIQVEECLQLKKQLHILQQQLKQLQERFAQPHELNDSSPSQGSMEKTLGLLKEKFGQSLDSQGVSSGHRRYRFCRNIPKTRGSEWSEKGTRTADSHSLTSEDRALSEILKRELIQVVTQAVDSVLKQFTRCITSQLIKWFSNFREFYYIQMEKFARQAVLEDVTDPSDLIVTRDSELFRILNVHYNKGNDFEVPDGFLDVSSLTLQEFFSAVRAGKDLDPSWKKPIYKIISKLDSEIPDAFKSSTCPKELNQG